MRSGRFIKAERNKEGAHIFWYIPVVSNSKSNISTKNTFPKISEINLDKSTAYKHPIFIVFGKNTIKCYARYLDNKKQTHLDTIFVLPINAPKKLNKILQNIYHQPLKLEGNYKYRSEYENYINTPKALVRNIAYWNLSPFNIKKDISKNQDETNTTVSIEKKLHISVRKIFLDFLFDLKHFSVFKESPYYEDLFLRLNENIFFQVISYKAEYYYRNALVNATREDFPKKTNFWQNIDVNQYGTTSNLLNSFCKKIEREKEAEREWLNAIIDNTNEKIIQEKNNWCQNPQKEYTSLFQFKKNKYRKNNPNFVLEDALKKAWELFLKLDLKAIFEIFKYIIITFFLFFRRQNLKEVYLSILFKKHIKKELFKINWIKKTQEIQIHKHFVSLLKIYYKWIAAKKHKEHISNSIDWLSRRYSIWDAIKIQLCYISGFLSKTIFPLGFIISFLMLYYYYYPSDTSPVLQKIFISQSIIISLVSSFLFAHITSRSLPRIVGFFRPNIFFASIVVWYLLGKYPSLWNLNLECNKFYISSAIGIFGLLIFLMYLKINEFNVFGLTNIRRSFLVVIVACIYSINIGVIIMSNNAERVLTLENTLYTYYDKIPKNELHSRIISNLNDVNYKQDDFLIEHLNTDTISVKKLLMDSAWIPCIQKNRTTIHKYIVESIDSIRFRGLKLNIDLPKPKTKNDSVQWVFKVIECSDSTFYDSNNEYYRQIIQMAILLDTSLVKKFIEIDITNLLNEKMYYKPRIHQDLFGYLKYLKSTNGMHPLMIEEKVDVPIMGTYTARIFPGILFFNTFMTLAIGIFIQIAFRDRPVI